MGRVSWSLQEKQDVVTAYILPSVRCASKLSSTSYQWHISLLNLSKPISSTSYQWLISLLNLSKPIQNFKNLNRKLNETIFVKTEFLYAISILLWVICSNLLYTLLFALTSGYCYYRQENTRDTFQFCSSKTNTKHELCLLITSWKPTST